MGNSFWMVTNGNWNFEFDAACNCSFVTFDLFTLIAYNNSVYQHLAKDETNYFNLRCKTCIQLILYVKWYITRINLDT